MKRQLVEESLQSFVLGSDPDENRHDGGVAASVVNQVNLASERVTGEDMFIRRMKMEVLEPVAGSGVARQEQQVVHPVRHRGAEVVAAVEAIHRRAVVVESQPVAKDALRVC